MCLCLSVCARACVRACVRARACVCVCVMLWVRQVFNFYFASACLNGQSTFGGEYCRFLRLLPPTKELNCLWSHPLMFV